MHPNACFRTFGCSPLPRLLVLNAPNRLLSHVWVLSFSSPAGFQCTQTPAFARLGALLFLARWFSVHPNTCFRPFGCSPLPRPLVFSAPKRLFSPVWVLSSSSPAGFQCTQTPALARLGALLFLARWFSMHPIACFRTFGCSPLPRPLVLNAPKRLLSPVWVHFNFCL